MSADLVERRHVPRHEPQPLAVMVANRPIADWLDKLVSVTLPKLIDKKKASVRRQRR